MMHNSVLLREFGPDAERVPAVPPPPDESRIDEAYERGVEDGLAQARAEISTEVLDAVRELAGRLDDLAADRQRIVADAVAEAAAEAGGVLAAVVRSTCPALAALGLADRAGRLLEENLRDAPRPLTIGVAPDVAERLETLMPETSDPSYSIEARPEMPITQVEIVWPEGGATIDVEALSSTIMGLASQLDPHSETVEQTPHE